MVQQNQTRKEIDKLSFPLDSINYSDYENTNPYQSPKSIEKTQEKRTVLKRIGNLANKINNIAFVSVPAMLLSSFALDITFRLGGGPKEAAIAAGITIIPTAYLGRILYKVEKKNEESYREIFK